MKRRARKLLTFLMACLILSSASGCGVVDQYCKDHWQETVYVTITKPPTPCPNPEPAKLKGLLADQHIGSGKNVLILINNVSTMNSYIAGLKNTNKCYTDQALPKE